MIKKDSKVTFHYRLSDTEGNLIESSFDDEPLNYTHGYGQMIVGVERALEGKSVGDEFSVTVPPEEGYGDSDESLYQQVSIEAFAEVTDLHVGMRFQAVDENGDTTTVKVIAIEDEIVTLDSNHPFAGMTLVFDIKVTDVAN